MLLADGNAASAAGFSSPSVVAPLVAQSAPPRFSSSLAPAPTVGSPSPQEQQFSRSLFDLPLPPLVEELQQTQKIDLNPKQMENPALCVKLKESNDRSVMGIEKKSCGSEIKEHHEAMLENVVDQNFGLSLVMNSIEHVVSELSQKVFSDSWVSKSRSTRRSQFLESIVMKRKFNRARLKRKMKRMEDFKKGYNKNKAAMATCLMNYGWARARKRTVKPDFGLLAMAATTTASTIRYTPEDPNIPKVWKDLLQKLSLDSQTKALEILEPNKKTVVYQYCDLDIHGQVPSYDRSWTKMLPSDTADPAVCYVPNAYQPYYYSAYGSGNHEGVDMNSKIYGENASLVYHQDYGYPTYLYSPATRPAPQIGGDGQLYDAQQYQYPNYFPNTTSSGPFLSSVATPTQGDLSANVADGANPVLITRGIEKTAKVLVSELKKISKEVEDNELADVAAVSAGNNDEIGNMIAEAMSKVGSKGVVTLEEGKSAESNLYVVEGMQFDRGYISPYFVADIEKMPVKFDNCKLLLVDKKITNARDLVGVLEDAIRGGYPILIIAEDIEQEALATLVVNKLRGTLKIAALQAPGFGERKSQYLDDIAILTGATVICEKVGLSLEKSRKEVLVNASKVVLTKEILTIVGDGSTHDAVQKRVTQIKNLIEQAEQDYEKEKLNERIAKLSDGVVVIQVGAQTETELKEKKLRVEDALNAAKAAVEGGIVIGGGCTLLCLASKVDAIKATLDNDKENVEIELVYNK